MPLTIYRALSATSLSARNSSTDSDNVASEAVATIATEATIAHAAIGQKDEHLTVAMQALTGHIEGDQALEVRGLADHESGSHTSTVETVADCIIVKPTVVQQAAVAESAVEGKVTAPKIRYNDPQAVYQRYIESRQAWYETQLRGSIKTNQSTERQWVCPSGTTRRSLLGASIGSRWVGNVKRKKNARDWTKEEMMSYLDWDKAEEDRVEAVVAAEMEANPFSERRGMGDIWKAAAADCAAQEALYLIK
ncbi:transposase-like protein [Beauveria bassiana ARSEF 2860]|uniref:Transposase-like protein n=1 Tax=Beauveria bassiana (strain ARSEF 2860) TaxID=655819 RepID=J5J499_BEAB2|nr:transposase-like protein [Beauveria bassiana ARSEF 2860]EJP61523.1 transposase-like protein [Beauveria bassiana ARSEF 2860]